MESFIEIPTYDANHTTWSYTIFEQRDEFVVFLKSLFKEPGKYEFDETSFLFNEQARKFNKNKFFVVLP